MATKIFEIKLNANEFINQAVEVQKQIDELKQKQKEKLIE